MSSGGADVCAARGTSGTSTTSNCSPASVDLPHKLVALRQACAENRVADAQRLFTNASEIIVDNPSIAWLGHRILGNDEKALAVLMEYDDMNDMRTMSSFLSYGIFDAGLYPNLMTVLEPQGIDRGEVVELPYQCKH